MEGFIVILLRGANEPISLLVFVVEDKEQHVEKSQVLPDDSQMKSSDDWDDVEDEEEDEYSDEASPEQKGIFKPDNYEEELPLGDRLKMLSHGAGPSRRKRRHVDLGENEKLSSVEMKTGKRATSRRMEKGDGAPKDSNSSAKPSGRANKNRPQELSSSRAVGRFREVVVSKREKSRDPRFEGGGKASKLNYDIFRKAFGFLEDYQDKEIEELKKSLKKEKNQERSARLSALLTRLQQERVERARGDRTREALRQERKKERQAVADGKKPYYLKNSDKKKMSLEQRYEGLKEEGKLGKFMEKKRKRNAAKDHRWLPAKRQDKG